jgi:hypothetical protein
MHHDPNPPLTGDLLPLRRAFDYAALPAAVATQAQAAAQRIRAHHQDQITAIIEIGHDLLVIKQQVKHGQFGAWLDAEFSMAERTAQNYMRAATAFGTKTALISDLPPTAIYTLAAPSTPAPVKDAVVARLEAGERLEAAEVQALVREAKAAERLAREEATLTPRQRKTRAQREAEVQGQREHWERDERQRNLAARAVAEFLAARLGVDLPAFLAQAQQADMGRVMRLLCDVPQNQ